MQHIYNHIIPATMATDMASDMVGLWIWLSQCTKYEAGQNRFDNLRLIHPTVKSRQIQPKQA